MDPILELSAIEAVARLRAKEIGAREIVESAYRRIEALDGELNAVPILCRERALGVADRIDVGEVGPRDDLPWLAGLPIVVKDTHDVEGVVTTQGSSIFRNFVAASSSVLVQRLEAAGAIVLGKSNTPEFAAGANTFNEVFGKTRNPYDPGLTCGGSSGGSAVALATHMAWFGTGSDLGGSLRTPASFCGIVGMRPSVGRVPRTSKYNAFQTLSVDGPMARTVSDVALMMDVIAGHEAADPLSCPATVPSHTAGLQEAPAIGRIGWSPDLGGITPVDPEVARVTEATTMRSAKALGAEVDGEIPDFSDSMEIFTTLRASLFVGNLAPLLETHRDQLKPEVIWNIEHGLKVDAGAIADAERKRSALVRAMTNFFESHDLLICPTAIVPPFDIDQRYLASLGDHTFPSYIDWCTICYGITITGCPSLSLPCGFTESGLPVAIQLVAPPGYDARLLATAKRFEEVIGFEPRRF